MKVQVRPFYRKYWTSENPEREFEVVRFSLTGRSAWVQFPDEIKCVPIEVLMDATAYGAEYPHCDQYVLHAPGECEYCDHYPFAQAARSHLGINYTGHYESGKAKCPAERIRSLHHINLWPGNTPEGYPWGRQESKTIVPSEYYDALVADLADEENVGKVYTWREIGRAIIRKLFR